MKFNSNNVLQGLNILLALLSLAVIGVSAWLATQADADCLSFLHWPFMVIGLLMFGLGVLGYASAARRNKPLLLIYLVLLILVALLFLAFTIFALVVTAQNSPGLSVHGASFREYTSADFPPWLRKRVSEPYWSSIQACLARGHLCSDLKTKYKTLKALYDADLSPTQVGCCKPPSPCGFVFEGATTWAPQVMESIENGSDCMKWSNSPSQLCFACDACKAGEMRIVRQHWLNVATVSLIVLVLILSLLALTSMALYTIKHNSIPDEPKVYSPNM